MLKEWKRVGVRQAFSCGLFEVKIDTSLSPRTGRPHDFYIIDTGDWVGVIPLTEEGTVVLVRQFRHGTRSFSLEIPGGLVEGDDPFGAARRELLEETGYEAGEMELLGVLRPQPAIFNNRYFLFLAQHLRRVSSPCLDEGEDIEVVEMPLEEVYRRMAEGEIDHALVLASFQLLSFRHPELRGERSL